MRLHHLQGLLLPALAAVSTATGSYSCPRDPLNCLDRHCKGRENFTTDRYVCDTGKYKGCLCVLGRCGSRLYDCNRSACAGENGPYGGIGRCTRGSLEGCTCNSVCPSEPPQCTSHACGGHGGKCQTLDLKGCECHNACPSKLPKCKSHACGGYRGKCQKEDLEGCKCRDY